MLLKAGDLTSWNIRGDTDFTQVTIRFNMATDGQLVTKDTKFKKVPPSQINRDRDRAYRWKYSTSGSYVQDDSNLLDYGHSKFDHFSNKENGRKSMKPVVNQPTPLQYHTEIANIEPSTPEAKSGQAQVDTTQTYCKPSTRSLTEEGASTKPTTSQVHNKENTTTDLVPTSHEELNSIDIRNMNNETPNRWDDSTHKIWQKKAIVID